MHGAFWVRGKYMEIAEYKNIFDNEGNHFFYVANHALVLSLVKRYARKKHLRILDAGCGTGLLGKKLEQFGNVVGIDVNDYALSLARRRGLAVKKASVARIPFVNNTFDLVVSIDVLYHKAVENDQKALAEIYRVLKLDGVFILRVPAHNWLRRGCDLQVHTRERYGRAMLQKRLTKAGFVVEKISYVNAVLLFPALILFVVEKLTNAKEKHSPLTPLPAFLNNLVIKLLSLESSLAITIGLPIGLGIIAVCRKGP